MSIDQEIYLEPAYSQHVLELIRLGHEYCLFIENTDEGSPEGLIRFSLRMLPMLYLKGLFLPKIDTEPEDTGERFVTQEEWENVFNNLKRGLDETDLFWTIDPEITGGNEAVKLSLAENLTDIYQDLKDFIMQYQKHTRAAKVTAVMECREWFTSRWGKRIAESTHYLHYLNFVQKAGSGYEELD